MVWQAVVSILKYGRSLYRIIKTMVGCCIIFNNVWQAVVSVLNYERSLYCLIKKYGEIYHIWQVVVSDLKNMQGRNMIELKHIW